MSWKCYYVTYELKSPLHVGHIRVRYLNRTRYYIPARALWGAVTAMLTQSGFSHGGGAEGDYESVGNWVRENLVFSYFFVILGNELLVPKYTVDGLKYGRMRLHEFERCCVSSNATTAIDPQVRAAEFGSLHEIEFIAPHAIDGTPLRIGGWIFFSDNAHDAIDGESGWEKYLCKLKVGGERRYGLGSMQCKSKELCERLMEYSIHLDDSRPSVTVPAGKPILAHVPADFGDISGDIEPIVGRETRENSSNFGMMLTKGQVCWTPGSIVKKDTTFMIAGNGIWLPQ